jgi:hypothetical protein
VCLSGNGVHNGDGRAAGHFTESPQPPALSPPMAADLLDEEACRRLMAQTRNSLANSDKDLTFPPRYKTSMDNTNAERQARFARREKAAQKTADRVKALEAENAALRNAIAAAKTTAPATALGTVAAKEHGIELEWEILVDGEPEGYISAYEEPFGLYVRQIGDMFFWHVLKDNNKDADKDAVNVAEGDEPSMIAAMAAAEAAARHLIRGP